jgi:hypothetical protein
LPSQIVIDGAHYPLNRAEPRDLVTGGLQYQLFLPDGIAFGSDVNRLWDRLNLVRSGCAIASQRCDTAKEKLTECRKISPIGETKLSGGAGKVRRYRYRTPALTGPWRESNEDAVGDAVKAKQAQYDDSEPEGVKWIVPGEIEMRNDARAAIGARR